MKKQCYLALLILLLPDSSLGGVSDLGVGCQWR